MKGHIPVLFQEAIQGLGLKEGQVVLDGTFGGGGHAREISTRIGKEGTLIAFDLDEKAFARTDFKQFPSRVIPVVENFRHCLREVTKQKITSIDAALFDLGFSSFTLEESGRGFSFQKDEPLLMTYGNPHAGDVTAEIVVNDWSEESLVSIFRGYGEERHSKRIANAIILAREQGRITGAKALAQVIASVVRRNPRGIHPATKVFQAIRMAVNDELGAMTEGLQGAFTLLSPGGRIAVITFHSGEDRVVKRLFRDWKDKGLVSILTKKPMIPTREEVSQNPRARSAKLRIVEKH